MNGHTNNKVVFGTRNN